MASGMLNRVLTDLNNIDAGLNSQAIKIVKEVDHIIIDMNTEQLYSGLNSKGQSLESIGGPYSPVTIEFKKLKGQPTDRVTLKDSGSFYDGFFLKVKNGTWQISSNDEKTQKLIGEWGKDIFGNTKEDEREINIEYILPGLIEWILSNLRL